MYDNIDVHFVFAWNHIEKAEVINYTKKAR